MVLLQARHHFEGRGGFLGPWILELSVLLLSLNSRPQGNQGFYKSNFLPSCTTAVLPGYSWTIQDHQNPKTPLHGATALLNLDCRTRVLGLVGEADACGVSPCRLAAPDLPVCSLSLHCQGTSECFFLSRLGFICGTFVCGLN